jgi:hypothetical protein
VHDCGSGIPVELLTRRGAKGTEAAIPETRDREAGPPPKKKIATVHQIKCLPLSVRKMTSKPAMRNHLRGSRRELQGRSPPIESYEALQGRLLGGEGGFHLAVSHFT